MEEKSTDIAGPATFPKVAIVIVDALRHDFADWKQNVTSEEKHYTNKLPIIRELQDRGQAKLFEFIADPPTTTLQRLKGLMTGGLPTFIDVSSNFASSDIGEDNVVQQLARAGKKYVLWLNLCNLCFNLNI